MFDSQMIHLSEVLTGQVVGPLARLWSEADDEADFCRQAARVWCGALGVTGAFVAFRAEVSQPWCAFSSDDALEPRLSELVAGLVEGSSSVLTDGADSWYPAQLTVPRPLGAVLFVPEPLGAEAQSALNIMAAGLSAHALGRRAMRADAMVGQVARKLQALQLLTLNVNTTYDLGGLSQGLCNIVAQAMGVEVAFLYHREAGGLRIVEDLEVFSAAGGSWREVLAQGQANAGDSLLPLEQAGFLAEVLSSGRAQAIDDVSAAVASVPQLAGRRLASLAAAPLVTQREELGVLVVGSLRPRYFSSLELDTLEEFAQAATGALLISRLYSTAREEGERAGTLVAQLRELTRATHEVGKTLDIHRACQELVEQLPRFMSPIHWVDVFLCKGDDWSFATGSSSNFSSPPDQWLYYLDKTGYPPSVELPREALAGTPFEQAGNVLLFPMRKQHDWLGLVVVATETATQTLGRDMVETLVTHTASALSNAISWEREHERSITDGLTGVYNRRFFNQRLVEEHEKGERYRRPFGLILLDIDHFKRCNDLLGHLAGDNLLKEIATVLRDYTRKVDIVARYGGEEFAVILPEATFDGTQKTAEKLRRAIERHGFKEQEQLPGGNITVSLGFACHPLHGRTPEQLIAVADQALYSAKQAGRDRVGVPALPE